MRPYYEDEAVTLYHGDCRELDAWLTADVLVTDPPYGVRWDPRFGDKRGPRAKRDRAADAITGDGDTTARDDALTAWGDRPAMVFGSWRIQRPRATRSLLIWNKEGAYTGPCRAPFFTSHEEIYVLGEGWPPSSPPLRSVLTTTEHRSQHTAKVGHPTPKPVGLMERLVERCPPGVIADPFAGSGSTLLAARNLGRKCIAVEVEKRYCELIVSRLAQEAFNFGGAA